MLHACASTAQGKEGRLHPLHLVHARGSSDLGAVCTWGRGGELARTSAVHAAPSDPACSVRVAGQGRRRGRAARGGALAAPLRRLRARDPRAGQRRDRGWLWAAHAVRRRGRPRRAPAPAPVRRGLFWRTPPACLLRPLPCTSVFPYVLLWPDPACLPRPCHAPPAPSCFGAPCMPVCNPCHAPVCPFVLFRPDPPPQHRGFLSGKYCSRSAACHQLGFWLLMPS
jgi:hypothetical protein